MSNYPPGFNERELDEKEKNNKLGVAGERKGFKFKNKNKKHKMAKKFKNPFKDALFQ